MQFLSGISLTCFVGSYLVVLLLEASRALVRVPARLVIGTGFTLAGLFSHLVYLMLRARPSLEAAEVGLWAGWYDWSLLLAWGLAACYLVLSLRRPETTVGYFLLPPVLGLIALAVAFRDWSPFTRDEAAGVWLTIHAFAMLVGTVAVLLGFIAGVMYLVQSTRLKHKRGGSPGLRLPTLEWLQGLNRHCLVASTVAVAIGWVAGMVMNLNRWGSVGWTDGGVILSGILLFWLLAATAFEILYKPARQGRKIAYLTLASFGFLVLAMSAILTGSHGQEENDPPAAAAGTAGVDRPVAPSDLSDRHGPRRSARGGAA